MKERFNSEMLASLMDAKGYSVEALANLVGTSQQTVYAWLAGSKPRFNSLVALCDVLGCDLFELAHIAAPDPNSLRSFETPINIRQYVNDIVREFPEAYCIEVKTNLADRVFPKGSYAFVDTAQIEPDGESIFAVSVGGEYPVFGRLERLSSGLRILPWSFDPTEQPITIDYTKGGEAEVLGKGVWILQPLENIK